jgi:hypothetical protein
MQAKYVEEGDSGYGGLEHILVRVVKKPEDTNPHNIEQALQDILSPTEDEINIRPSIMLEGRDGEGRHIDAMVNFFNGVEIK